MELDPAGVSTNPSSRRMRPSMSPRDMVRRREPTRERAPRMGALATLPVFFKLTGKRVVVVGGGKAAAWKAELLSAAGAKVEIWASDPCPEMELLAAVPPAGPIAIERQAWRPHAFAGAELVVCAADDEEEAHRLYMAGRAAGVPINVIDRPAFCTFQFGAVVNRSPLVVGISTDGAAPVFAQAIRSRIEISLPSGFSRWAQAARTWREELRGLNLGAKARRRFWERFSFLAMREPAREPSREERERLLQETLGEADLRQPLGRVTLIGAGPGDPELLTLAAVRALRSADVVLYDDLVTSEILDFARREAQRVRVGKTGHGPSCKQDDINNLMLEFARSGKHVVRLKAGDPLIFGRASEELRALERENVPVAVVPGITAVQGAAATLKIPLTHRGRARRLQFVTGHAEGGSLPGDLDLAALTDPGAITAIYMPRATLGQLCERMVQAGARPDRPATAIFNATRGNQRVVEGTLSTISTLVRAAADIGPCLVLIGTDHSAKSETSRLQRVGFSRTAKGVPLPKLAR